MSKSRLSRAGAVPVFLSLFCGALSTGTSRGQDAPALPDLATVCAKMRALPGVTWKTFEEQDQAMMRRFRAMMPAAARETEVSGTAAGDWLSARLFDGEHEVVFLGNRMIARTAEGEWRPRSGVTSNGTPLPFVFDPARFFDRLAGCCADGKDLRTEDSTWREKPWRVVTISLSDDAARDLVLGGGVPRLGGGMRGAIMLGGPGGGAGADEDPEIMVDLALWLDPQTGLCHRVKASAYEESAMPGNVHIEFGGAEVADDDAKAEKPVEFDAEGKRIYKGGLPVREVGESTSTMSFEVVLSEHGTTAAPKLDAMGQALLGVTGGK